MARTAFTAPAHIVKQRNAPGNTATQPDSAPSLGYGGMSLIDPRLVWNKYNGLGNGAACAAIGWAGQDDITVLDYTPPAASTTNIAAANTVTSGTAMTLVSSSGSGVVVTSAAFVALPSLQTIPSGSIAMGTQMGYLFLGIRDITGYYDPTKAWACAVQVTAAASATGGAFIIRGADVYGFPLAEQITAVANSSVNGKKAFKWVTSVTPQFTDGSHNYSVGTTDITGLNLAADSAGYVTEWLSGTGYTANPSITAAVTTNPATATTGDVRGTITLTNAAYVLSVSVSAARATTVPLSTGLFGVAQFTE